MEQAGRMPVIINYQSSIINHSSPAGIAHSPFYLGYLGKMDLTFWGIKRKIIVGSCAIGIGMACIRFPVAARSRLWPVVRQTQGPIEWLVTGLQKRCNS